MTSRNNERSHRAARLAVAGLLVGGFLLALWGGIRIRQDLLLVARMRGAPQGLTECLAEKGSECYRELLGGLGHLETDLNIARVVLGPILTSAEAAGWLPVVGANLKAVAVLFDEALYLARAGRLLGEAAQPVAEQVIAGLSAGAATPDANQSNPKTLEIAEPKAMAAKALLQEAKIRAATVEHAVLSSPLSEYLKDAGRAVSYLDVAADAAIMGSKLADGFLGLSHLESIMVLAQNNDELRATGGFIAGAWLISVYRGKIAATQFYDSYQVDDLSKPYPEPPPALTDVLWGGAWLFRDSNWSPDFPTSARQAIDSFRYGKGRSASAVIAVDLTATRYLLDAIGPVYLEDYGGWLEPDDVMGLLENAPQGRRPPSSAGTAQPRKLAMSALFNSMAAKLKTERDDSRWRALIDAIKRGLDEKHVLVYHENPKTAAFLKEKNWDGSLKPTEGDYLQVVDSNVGFNKVNANIEQTISYSIRLDASGNGYSSLKLSYQNDSANIGASCLQQDLPDASYAELKNGCYWDYLRAYVPRGAALQRATESDWPESSLLARVGQQKGPRQPTLEASGGDKTIIGDFFVVPAGERSALEFEYLTKGAAKSDGTDQLIYDLTVQKQPGTPALSLSVQIVPPDGMKIAAASPAPYQQTDDMVEFKLSLAADVAFQVIFSRR